jgi:trimethylamine--corrinoid protein Co-methyltransferase
VSTCTKREVDVPLRVWSDETCASVHDATLRILAGTGVDVHHGGALRLLEAAGASIDGRRARIPASLVADALEAAPKVFDLPSRGGYEPLVMDTDHTYYGTGSDCLYVRDPGSGERRRATMADVQGMAAVTELLPNIDFVMSMGLPEDVPQSVDDLSQFAAMLRGSRKPILLSARDGRILAAMREMAAACGEARSFAIYAMPAPPLSHEAEAADKLIVCAQLGIPIIYATAPAAGATAPMSRAAVAVTGNAEALSGLVVHQLASPGAPFVYGVASTSVPAPCSTRRPRRSPCSTPAATSRATTTSRRSRSEEAPTPNASTGSGLPRRRSRSRWALSRERRSCTTSASSSRACRARMKPSF